MEGRGEERRKTGFERALSASVAVGAEGGVATPFTQPHLGECDVREKARKGRKREREREMGKHQSLLP